jgi:hypothetical protein
VPDRRTDDFAMEPGLLAGANLSIMRMLAAKRP